MQRGCQTRTVLWMTVTTVDDANLRLFTATPAASSTVALRASKSVAAQFTSATTLSSGPLPVLRAGSAGQHRHWFSFQKHVKFAPWIEDTLAQDLLQIPGPKCPSVLEMWSFRYLTPTQVPCMHRL